MERLGQSSLPSNALLAILGTQSHAVDADLIGMQRRIISDTVWDAVMSRHPKRSAGIAKALVPHATTPERATALLEGERRASVLADLLWTPGISPEQALDVIERFGDKRPIVVACERLMKPADAPQWTAEIDEDAAAKMARCVGIGYLLELTAAKSTTVDDVREALGSDWQTRLESIRSSERLHLKRGIASLLARFPELREEWTSEYASDDLIGKVVGCPALNDEQVERVKARLLAAPSERTAFSALAFMWNPTVSDDTMLDFREKFLQVCSETPGVPMYSEGIRRIDQMLSRGNYKQWQTLQNGVLATDDDNQINQFYGWVLKQPEIRLPYLGACVPASTLASVPVRRRLHPEWSELLVESHRMLLTNVLAVFDGAHESWAPIRQEVADRPDGSIYSRHVGLITADRSPWDKDLADAAGCPPSYQRVETLRSVGFVVRKDQETHDLLELSVEGWTVLLSQLETVGGSTPMIELIEVAKLVAGE